MDARTPIRKNMSPRPGIFLVFLNLSHPEIRRQDQYGGLRRIEYLKRLGSYFRRGLEGLRLQSIPGPHPIIPLLVRETARTHASVKNLYDEGVLVVGLTQPVVPRGYEE